MLDLKTKYKLACALLSHPMLKDFRKAGFIDDLCIRNCHIIIDYHTLRKKLKHIDALYHLSEKYLISPERISSILYK